MTVHTAARQARPETFAFPDTAPGDDAVVDDFADRLRLAMDLAGGIQQTELARRIGVGKAAINQVLTRHTKALNAERALRAARILQVDPWWLVSGEGVPRPVYLVERQTLSPRAVYIGLQLDALPTQSARDRAYSLIVQILDFGADMGSDIGH